MLAMTNTMNKNGMMTVRVEVPSELIRWARMRSRIEPEELLRRFPRLEQWETGETLPTLKQLEKYAKATRTPVGYFFLAAPPDDEVPIPDYRTVADEPLGEPSPDLLDTIYQCQQRQEWFRDYAIRNRLDECPAVGSATLDAPVVDVAEEMRSLLEFAVDHRGPSWADAFRRLSEASEDLGILVMVNGVVGSNTHRKLDPREFRGFALVDPLAPVVFVNGADTRAAQVFTLAHELAHIWLGETGLDDIDLGHRSPQDVERWCNAVAAELLVPMDEFRRQFERTGELTQDLDRLARTFKVSTLVILRRAHEAGFFTWEEYREAYQSEIDRLLPLVEQARGGGGNFYHTQPTRVSKLFARAVIASTLEGQTLYTEAFQMLGFRKKATFDALAERLDVA